MDLRFSAEELAFRDELRAFIRDKLPTDIRDRMRLGYSAEKEDTTRWQRILNERHWAAYMWPQEWGGPGWSPIQRMIFLEENQLANAPDMQVFNITMIGPVLIQFGTDEQKQRFLPRAANLDDWWCQGFSEPGAGSDLAALKTAAKRVGDEYVVNGQKIWTSTAHMADWCFCLVRTDPNAPKRQMGITFLLIDMKTPGITVRPLIEDPIFRQRVAQFEVDIKALDITNLRVISAHDKNKDSGKPDPLTSVLKIKGTELLQSTTEMVMDVGGPLSMPDWAAELTALSNEPELGPAWPAETTRSYLMLRAASIYGGTNEIMKNIVSKAVLGL
jgi:alkylation response protein AidB-like acyl-CoA dehydrogenase